MQQSYLMLALVLGDLVNWEKVAWGLVALGIVFVVVWLLVELIEAKEALKELPSRR